MLSPPQENVAYQNRVGELPVRWMARRGICRGIERGPERAGNVKVGQAE